MKRFANKRRDAEPGGARPLRRVAATLVWVCGAALAEPIVIVQVPGGNSRTIELSHAGPQGDLIAPAPLDALPFRPPAIFSAPLPSGSGARALGLAGAFTAIADDATAASWNPAGLTQRERPEASAVYRVSAERDQHHSTDVDFAVGVDDFQNQNLNYLSLVYPFRAGLIQRNAVVSLNYQEAYDFTEQFSAVISGRTRTRQHVEASDTFQDVQTDKIKDDIFDLKVTTFETTQTRSVLDQTIDADLDSSIDFQQEGSIAAISPACAIEVTPRLSAGLALNYYLLDPFSGGRIQSRTHATYSGMTHSTVNGATTRTTSGTFVYTGTADPPPNSFGDPPAFGISDTGTFDPFTDTTPSHRRDDVYIDGTFDEENTIEDLNGINATLGLLLTVNRRLGLGAALDLPWTAHAQQRQMTHNRSTTFNSSRTAVLDQVDELTTVTKQVDIDFPMSWSVGAVARWTPEFYTTLDVSQTYWSEFAFQAEGEGRLNPLDGSPHGEHPLDDTWAVRLGTEYLILLRKREIPLRGGLAWEQRPALENPDDYYSVSLGSGVSFGDEPGRTILDLAYIFTFADDVQGGVPGQGGLTTDVRTHECFVSVIQHF